MGFLVCLFAASHQGPLQTGRAWMAMVNPLFFHPHPRSTRLYHPLSSREGRSV